MNAPLPDVARSAAGGDNRSLDAVGMERIAMPLCLAAAEKGRADSALVDLFVDLPAAGERRGIHMSRLYRLLTRFCEEQTLSPRNLHALLARCIESHTDCGSTRARIRLDFALVLKRPALITDDTGWRRYPVTVEAQLRGGDFHCRLALDVTYSSTCPCSAALARELIRKAFLEDFNKRKDLAPEEVADWLRQHATLATPHSQRSVAEISVALSPDAQQLNAIALIDDVETVLATPVQSLVRRADEQAFARRNGTNLMYVEDASRRLAGHLHARHAQPRIRVRHLESLHAHDAVAEVCTPPPL